jgi:phenylpropionate dioxygenase-like ring-hydroxylating dioxygenase large terminal subunit
MLSKELNELMTRVGPGTPMGNLLRRYWMPALLSSEVPNADSDPVRVRLMGEDLVAFRDTNGAIGLIQNNCPHRGASLFFGRNEEAGIRCVYHGWKFDFSGQCVDMPNEPVESDFKSKVRATAYPTHESGGIVWTYMGPPEKQLPFRNFGTDDLPREQWRASKTLSYCNFVQAMEGNLDTAHISYLHRNLDDSSLADDGTDRPGYSTQDVSTRVKAQNRSPRVEVEDTPYGFRYAGIRDTPNGHEQIRMTVFAMPVMTFVSAIPFGGSCGMFVPIDDHNCWRIQVRVHPTEGSSGRGYTLPMPGGRQTGRLSGKQERFVQPENDYLMDRALQRTTTYTGIPGIQEQDLAVTESMGPIYDRSQERLGTTDRAIIRMRQMLINAAQDLEHGIDPPGLDPTFDYTRLRSTEKIIAAGEDWRRLATSDDPAYAELLATGNMPLTGLVAAGALTS